MAAVLKMNSGVHVIGSATEIKMFDR